MTVAQGTPRTNERAKRFQLSSGGYDIPIRIEGEWCHAEFARELERENAALSAQVAALTEKFEATDVIVVAAKQAHANAQFRAQALAAQVVELQKELARAEEQITEYGHEIQGLRS